MMAIFFGPNQTQEQYCLEAQRSQEITIINNKPQLSYEAIVKENICNRILTNQKKNKYQ